MSRLHHFCGALILCSIALLQPGDASACLHAMAAVHVEPVSHTAILIHRDGQQTIVTRFQFAADPPTRKLAIVFPVPARPTEYGTASPGVFDDVHDWQAPRRIEKMKGIARGGSSAPSSTVEELARVEVGPYRIQPLQSGDPDAVSRWLAEHDLQPIEAERLAHYTEHRWTFLVVEVALDAQASRSELPPFSVTFPSTAITYPTDLERPRTGTMPGRFYVFSERPVGEVRRPRAMHELHWHRLRTSYPEFATDEAPESLRPLLGRGSDSTWYTEVFDFELVNYDAARIRSYPDPMRELLIEFGDRRAPVSPRSRTKSAGLGEMMIIGGASRAPETPDARKPATEEPDAGKPAAEAGGCGHVQSGGHGFLGLLVLLATAGRARSRRYS